MQHCLLPSRPDFLKTNVYKIWFNISIFFLSVCPLSNEQNERQLSRNYLSGFSFRVENELLNGSTNWHFSAILDHMAGLNHGIAFTRIYSSVISQFEITDREVSRFPVRVMYVPKQLLPSRVIYNTYNSTE